MPCIASGEYIFFKVKNVTINHDLRNQGFDDSMTTEPNGSDPFVLKRMLRVTGTMQNNGSEITCVVISSSSSKESEPAILYIGGLYSIKSVFVHVCLKHVCFILFLVMQK